MSSRNPSCLIRPLVRELHAYVPGEQPKIKGLIKLNTNENPYPPSPKVLAAIKAAADERLRLYPNPTAETARKAGELHGAGRKISSSATVGRVAGARGAGLCGAEAGQIVKSKRPRWRGHGAVFHAQLLALSGAGGHPRRGEKCGEIETRFPLPTVPELKRGSKWNLTRR